MKDPSIPLTIIKDVKEQDFEVAEDLFTLRALTDIVEHKPM